MIFVDTQRGSTELSLLARYDTDPFARWDATQEVAFRHLLAEMPAPNNKTKQPGMETLLAIWQSALQDSTLSPAYRTRLLTLPALRELIERSNPMAPQAAIQSWNQTQQSLGSALLDQWRALYDSLADDGGPYSPDPVSAGRRSLRNLALGYLLAAGETGAIDSARQQYAQARNMSESLGALTALTRHAPEAAADPLQHFHQRWQHDPLVLDSWFAIQASAPSSTVARIRALMALPDFTLRTPNRARAVIFRFCLDNPANLHTPEGYDFWVEQVLALNQINPEIAARLTRAFDHWSRFEPTSRAGMQAALQRVRAAPDLSRNVLEIVTKALGG